MVDFFFHQYPTAKKAGRDVIFWALSCFLTRLTDYEALIFPLKSLYFQGGSECSIFAVHLFKAQNSVAWQSSRTIRTGRSSNMLQTVTTPKKFCSAIKRIYRYFLLFFAQDSMIHWLARPLQETRNHFLPEKIIFNQRRMYHATIN